MEFIKTSMEGLVIIEPKVFEDERGYFFESYSEVLFKENGVDVNFVQDNQSLSHTGVLRGLHFQAPPYAQGKFVRVIKGAVMDVVVDIRKDSTTYGKHEKVLLTEENKRMLWVPAGFAHGFVTLRDNTVFFYKCTNAYNKQSEGGVMWNDKDLGIDWEIENPILSDKDTVLADFSTFVSPF